MLPKVGDFVKLTKSFAENNFGFDDIKEKKLEVMKVSLYSITNSGSFHRVYIVGDGTLKMFVIDDNGKHDDCVVFEFYDPQTYGQVNGPHEDDICKNCGAMGEVRQMSCVCPSCGNLIWGM